MLWGWVAVIVMARGHLGVGPTIVRRAPCERPLQPRLRDPAGMPSRSKAATRPKSARPKPPNPMVASLARESNPLRRFFRILGPGFVTGASDDDPSGIATYAN